ncbi:hypothetical protein [Labrys miyagiensis]|uniref:hypothetical protein n=1 Tax=Labrys miyagiensis TaxID=346912 RepID=UPI0024E0C0DA|nr:hypothetical protein [Labrys miyagiensis]
MATAEPPQWPIFRRQSTNSSAPRCTASTAAPTFFDPEAIDIGGTIKGAFVDGGVSLHNNPALLLFLVATLRGFPFRWPIDEHKLLLVSVGTGYWDEARSFEKVMSALVGLGLDRS